MFKLLVPLITVFLAFDVCGYKPSGKGKALPSSIKTIAVPVFKNSSLRYRVEQRFTRAVVDEILRRARGIRVVSTTDDADAVLEGDIRSFRAQGAILDDLGRTRVWNVRIIASVTLRDLHSRKILFSNPRLTFEGEYELSEDPQSFFNEENPAVERIAKAFAQSIISTFMEGQ